jgi:hypothetical protein
MQQQALMSKAFAVDLWLMHSREPMRESKNKKNRSQPQVELRESDAPRPLD